MSALTISAATPRRDTALNSTIEIELIRSLFHTLVPSIIMSVGFVVAGAMMAWWTKDALLALLLAGGTLTSVLRVAAAARSGERARRPDLLIDEARLLERRFTRNYIAFAVMLGGFAARLFWLPSPPQMHMLMVCLLVGYCAGVAAGAGLRPRIAIWSMCLALSPPLPVMLWRGDAFYWATVGMILALLAGGILSLRVRHGRAIEDLDRQMTFATLARNDVLTSLPNRLALREWFDQLCSKTKVPGSIAVHCLDLDGFKTVNDSYGHPVGDALLAAVAARLSRAVRDVDFAARLGGDEFAIVQREIRSVDEAEKLARRIQESLGWPFKLGEHVVEITSSIGYVTADGSAADLDRLIELADKAMYASKRSGGIVHYKLSTMQDVAA